MIYLKKLYMLVALTIVSLCALAHCAALLLVGINTFPDLIEGTLQLWSEEFGK